MSGPRFREVIEIQRIRDRHIVEPLGDMMLAVSCVVQEWTCQRVAQHYPSWMWISDCNMRDMLTYKLVHMDMYKRNARDHYYAWAELHGDNIKFEVRAALQNLAATLLRCDVALASVDLDKRIEQACEHIQQTAAEHWATVASR